MKFITKIPVLALLFILIAFLFVAYFKRKDMVDMQNVQSNNSAIKENQLTPAQYKVLKEGGTEVPYTSPLLNEKRKGTYVTADCGIPVFRSEHKFDSGTGWPSFYQPISRDAVIEKEDTSGGDSRTEVVSSECNSHLGHVFNDAPQTPTGLRYCINGLALVFIPDKIQ